MRVLVCGGRDFDNPKRIDEILRPIGITLLIQGGQRTWVRREFRYIGADAQAQDWARANGITCVTYHADWDRFGRSAGPRRNTRMLVEARPELGVSFPGGSGTKDMTDKLNAAGIRVIEVPR